MARPFRELAPDRLQIREGGGFLTAFGLPFLAAGVFVGLLSLRIIPVTNASEVPDFAWPGLFLLGTLFALVGSVLAFGRSWTTIDSTRRLIVKELGLLMPMRRRTHRIDDYTVVMLGFDRGDSDSADRFPVALKARAGPDLRLCSFTKFADARACAAAVARHLRFDIEDVSTDHPTRRPAGQADLSFQQRLRLDQRETGYAERPPGMRSEVREENQSVRVVVPVRRVHPVVFAAMLIPLAVSWVILGRAVRFLRETQTPDPVAWFFVGILAFVFGTLPALIALNQYLRSRRGRTIVTVSTEGIRIQSRGAWRTRTTAAMSAAEIMDVDFSTRESLTAAAKRIAEQQALHAGQSAGPPVTGPRTERVLAGLSRLAQGRGVQIKTRDGLTEFGEGLGDEEIRYLHSVVLRALEGRGIPVRPE